MTSLKRVLAQVFLCAAACTWLVGASAQNLTDRAGRWEASFNVLYGESKTVNSDNSSSADIDGSYGWGFGIGYNFNDHFGLEFNGSWRQSDYKATTTPAAGNANGRQSFSGTLDAGNMSLNGTYNLLARALTPFVTGGIGATYINTDIPAGLPVNVCWWDPWWGYYCGTYMPTRTAYYVSYSGGLGLRWEVDRNVFLRAVAIRQWLDVGGSIGQPYTDQYRFDVGFKF
jgi:opacity protein-like surface antigen